MRSVDVLIWLGGPMLTQMVLWFGTMGQTG